MRGIGNVIGAIAAVLLPASSLFPAELMGLRQAMRAAVVKAEMDDAAVSLAEGQLHLLKSLDRVKIELRPQLGMFSFSQPQLFATSAGAGVVFSRRTAPADSAIQQAQLDSLATELAQKRARLRTEIETARQFFDLLEKQQIAQRTCNAFDQIQKRQGEMVKLVQTAKVTAVDKVRYEEQVLDRQLECVQAETQRKVSALRLSASTGVQDRSANLRVEEAEVIGLGSERPMPSLERLVEIALTFRSEPKLVREQAAALRPKAGLATRIRPDVFSLGYYRVQESSKVFGSTTPGYLLGGNTVRAESSWNVPLRHTGEHAAAKEIVDAKLKSLESALAAIREEIRNELAAMHVLASSSAEKLSIARKKLDLSTQGRTMVTTRFQHGLTGSAAAFEAEQDTLRAQSGFTQATYELKASTFIMLAISGIHEKPIVEQERLLSSLSAPAPNLIGRSTGAGQ